MAVGVYGAAQESSTLSSVISLNRHSVGTSCQQMTFDLNGAPPNHDWIFGVKTESDQNCYFWAGTLDLQKHPHGKMRHIAAATDWPESAMSINGSTVSINTQTGSTEHLLIYATVPAGTKVVMKNAGQVIMDFTPTTGLMLYNGKPMPDELQGIQSLFIRLVQSGVGSGPPIFKLADGSYVVNHVNLKSHVLSASLPDFSAPARACACTMNASFELYITASGKVSSVRTLHGDPALVSALPAAMTDWVFQPFSNESGTIVPVRSPVSIIIDASGTAHW